METIDERIKRANSKYKVEETIDERIERVNREYEWDSRDREMHDWLESSSRTARNANSRLQNSSYTNWKRDSESTRASVNSELERADRIKSYLESQREQLGEERYNTFMSRYAEYKNALQQTSQNLDNESAYYSDTRNPGVVDSMTEDDIKDRLKTVDSDIRKERLKSWGSKIANKIAAGISLHDGDYDKYKEYEEKSKKAMDDLNRHKEERDMLESEIYNRDIEEKLGQFDEETINQIKSIPELKDRIEVEKSVGTQANDNKVYEYNQQLKEIEDKIRAKGLNPDELEKYFQYEYNSRKNVQAQELMHDFAGDNETLASALSVPINLTSSGKGYLDAAGQHIQNKLTGSYAPIDYNTNAGIASQLSDTMRGAVMENHDWNVGDWDSFDFLYGTGMSALDSAAAAATGNLVGGSLANVGAGMKVAGKVSEAVGGGILGLSAANSAMRDIKARGGSDNQAIVGGAVSGIFEGLFEKVSIGNFNKLKEVDPRSMKDVAMNILKSTGVNFSEEAATEIANIAYDTIANGNISNYKLAIAAYEKQGLSEAEAKRKVAGDLALQVVEAGAGGALMGAGFGVVGSGLGYLNNRNQGLTVSENQKARQTTPGFEGGEQTQIAQRLENLGESSQDAVKLAPVVLKQTEGDKLTRAEKKLLKGSQNAQNVAAEIKNGTTDTAENSQMSLKKDIETIKQEYKKAVNPKIVDFVNKVRNFKNKEAANKVHIDLKGITEREVHDIKKLTGIDTSEYKRSMDGNAIEHIEKNHGKNGVSDNSMSDVEDIARIEYVLDNYDNIEKGTANKVYNKYMNSDNTPASKVVYSKRVNGNYYVVEAVPDSKSKTLHIISAYKEKAEGVSQVLNMSEDPQLTSQTPHAFAPSDNNISQKKSYVNAVPATIDGQSVTINGIDRIEKDGNRAQMYVRTQDGGSVALSDVRFDSRETEALYNVAQGFDSTDTARAFISGYNQGDSASEYMNAFFDFRRAGMLGQDFDSVLQSTANRYGNLEVSQLRQAYYAGVNEETNAPKLYSKREEARAEKKGGLLRNYTRKLSAEQAGSVYVIEALAKKYGFVAEIRDSIADGAANGEYDPRTGRIIIALDAEENAYLRVAGHELYHYIENWNPDAATELREYVVDRLKESDSYDYEGRVNELKSLYDGFDSADIESEIVAECMFDVFDENTIRELVEENRPLAVKIQSWFRGFIESINEALTKLGLKSPEVRALEDNMEALENISSMFKTALEGAKENKSQGKTTDMADEKKKYSIGKTTKNKSVVVIADDILKGVDKSDWVAKVKDVIRTKFSDGIPVEGKLIKVNKITRNEYTNSKNTQHYQRKDAVIYKDKFKASSNLNEIVLASTNYVNEDLKHQRKDNFTEFARGDVLVRVGKNDYSAKVIVGFTSGKEMVLYDIVDFTPTKFELKNENAFTEQPLKVQLSRQHASSDTRVTQSEPSVNSSISEKAQNDAKKFSLKDTTNESDSQTKSEAFKEWFGDWENEPESASKVVNEDGTPRIIYHQTAAEFNVFSNANPLAGRNDSETPNGFFAKDNDADIGVGGNKQMALYGDMKKPLHFKDRAEAKAWYSEHIDGYKGLAEKLNKLDEEYQSKYDAQEKSNDEYYERNYEAYVADDAEVTQTILKNEDKLDGILEQWKEDTEAIRGELRELLNGYFIENDSGYDGIILDFDGRRKGENVKSYIFFKNTQLKSATDNIGLFDKKNPDIRYSLKSTSTIEEQNKKLMQENKVLHEYVHELEYQLGKNRHELDESKIKTLARKVLKQTNSKYELDTLTQNLKNIFEYIANARELTLEDVMHRTSEVAKAVLEESEVLNTELYEQYAPLRDYARTTPIRLSENQKAEIAYHYGSYDEFRRQNFGRIRFSEKGMTLDSLWGEISDMWPELFDADANELEQAETLVNAVRSVSDKVYENPYGMDMDEASYDLAMQLYEEYYNIPELKTLRQKIEQEYYKKYEKSIEKIRAQEMKKRDKISEQLIEQKAIYEKKLSDYKVERLQQEAIAKHKHSIERGTKTLNRWLQTPNKTQHVPEALRAALGEFLVSLDVYGSGQSKDAYEWRASMSELQRELEKMQGADNTEAQQFLLDLDPDLLPLMTTVMDVYKGSSLKDMDAQGLAQLDTVVQQLKSGIKMANKLLANSRYETVQAIADASVREMDKRKSFKDKVKLGYKQLNVNMLDSFSFFHQLGPSAESVFKSIRSGFDERVEMIDDANQFMQSIVSQKEIQEWEHSKQTFKVEGGELTLTVSQMMELYNLSKREQAKDHLLLGGIRPLDTARQETKARIKEQLGKGEETYAKAVQVTVEDLGKIIDALTPRQKQVAQRMQSFLSGNVADWGNKASMTLYGYKKFTETHYWPIQVNKNSVRTMNAEDGAVQTQTNFYKLVNIGATKSVQKNASNGLFIKGAFDTFTKHITEMSAYSAYAVPVTDAMKWYNALSFEEKDDGYIAISGTKQSIERAFGSDGKAYFEKFILDLNGSSDSKNAGGAGEETLIRNFKVAAVGANIRVAIQQPTAYLRAAAVMDPKYLLKGLFAKPASKEAIDNCPIAKWKSWGFYETSMGITMKQLITGQQTVVDKIREKSMWLAGVGDELTWGTLWNACKAEVLDKTDLQEGTAEFTQAVSDRLSEVVDKTQVVDSLLHRSQFMRSTSSFSKMLSAFKAEPTKSYNMLRNALVDYNNAEPGSKKTQAKNIARIAVVHIATSLLTAGIASIADAFRNDDDEKKWLELYLEAFGGNALDGINPFSAVPYVGDILSILSGYSASRMDIEGIEELIQSCESWQKVFSGEKKNPDVWKLMMNSAKGLSKVSGLPVANAMRTFESLYNFFSPDNLGKEASSTEYRRLYKSIGEGKYQETYDKLVKKGYTAQQLENGVKNNLVKSEPRIAEAAQARERGEISEYKRIYTELVDEGYPSNAVIKAINNYMTMQTAAAQAKKNGDEDTLNSKLESLLESGYDEAEVDKIIDEIAAGLNYEDESDKAAEEKKLYEYKDLQRALKNSDVSAANEIVQYLRENGKEDKTIRQALTKDLKTEYQEMYKKNDTDGMRKMRQTLYELNIGYDDKDFQRWVQDLK